MQHMHIYNICISVKKQIQDNDVQKLPYSFFFPTYRSKITQRSTAKPLCKVCAYKTNVEHFYRGKK